jgi:hypothetical protein
MGERLLPAYLFKLFRGQDFSMIPTEYYSGYLYNFESMMSSVSILMMLSLGLLFPLT